MLVAEQNVLIVHGPLAGFHAVVARAAAGEDAAIRITFRGQQENLLVPSAWLVPLDAAPAATALAAPFSVGDRVEFLRLNGTGIVRGILDADRLVIDATLVDGTTFTGTFHTDDVRRI